MSDPKAIQSDLQALPPLPPPPGPRDSQHPWPSSSRMAAVALLLGALLIATLVGIGSVADRGGSEQPIAKPRAPLASMPGSTSSDTSLGSTNAVVAAVEPGVVDITTFTRSSYAGGSASSEPLGAGTGMILTSSGEVLTNNHVIEGATSIRVAIPGGGPTYSAELVGTDPTHDVAVIQLTGASGLTPVALGDSSNLLVGDQLVAIGNAFVRGGTPSVSVGTVAALDQTIIANGALGGSERLHGLIRMNIAISPGESGGPVADESGQVVGMITAGQQIPGSSSSRTGFAIGVDTATTFVNAIRSGQRSDSIVLGPRGILGVQVADLTDRTASQIGLPISRGALVVEVVPGTPAAQTGIPRYGAIVAIDGNQVTSAHSLGTALFDKKPGDIVLVTWTDNSGTHVSSVVLIEGPAP
jgi:S1-C subfamily serine protease